MITSQDKEIQALVSDIRDGRLLLPELQRAYVWKAPQVRDLFDSLYHEYPSGQLLMWETADIPFSETMAVDGVIQQQRNPQLLLDGQQRLTSLSAVMLGRDLIMHGSTKPIDIAFNVFTEKFAVAGPKLHSEPGWISLAKLFTAGVPSILRELKLDLSNSESDQVFDRLNRLDKIKAYKYRVNVLDNLSYEEVTHIFVRVNSGGTKLGSADLALAQMSSRWRGVTQEFDEYQKKVAKLGLTLDSGLLLRAMAVLLGRPTRLSQLFRGDRQEVTVEDLKAAWKRVKVSMDQAISFLINNCRIDRLALLPTNNLLIPLAAFFDRTSGQVSSVDARALQRWVYMALMWSRYSATVETRLDQDVAALSKDQPIQAMIRNIEEVIGPQRAVTEDRLQDQRKNSAYMVMAYVLARQASAEDWFNAVVIGAEQPLEFHHIFPKALLRDHYDLKADSRTVDQVANLAFLSKRANVKISSSAPSAYLPTIDEQRLRAQYVPLEPFLWEMDKFEEFLLRRRTMLANAINSLMQSLTEKPAVWTVTSKTILEARVNAIEHDIRETIAIRLSEAWGGSAWDHCVPKPIRSNVQDRIAQRIQQNPWENSSYESLKAKLELAQFSDYAKIIKANWPLFSEVFGSEATFDQRMRSATDARNALKHNRELNSSELAMAEGGLLWIESCLDTALSQDDEKIDEGEDSDSEEEVAS